MKNRLKRSIAAVISAALLVTTAFSGIKMVMAEEDGLVDVSGSEIIEQDNGDFPFYNSDLPLIDGIIPPPVPGNGVTPATGSDLDPAPTTSSDLLPTTGSDLFPPISDDSNPATGSDLDPAPATNSDLDPVPVIVSSQDANGLSWQLNVTTGAMTISGSGPMVESFQASGVPWNGYAPLITSVSVT